MRVVGVPRSFYQLAKTARGSLTAETQERLRWVQLIKASRHHPIRMALQWYLLSNDTQPLEGSIVLTQAALERLSQEMDGKKRERKEGD